MIKNTLRLNTTSCNSLRLGNLFGSSDEGVVIDKTLEWFFNGSVKFEPLKDVIKIFNNVSEAVSYFTLNLTINQRCIGQVVTFALNNINNWVFYLYEGNSCVDEFYSNESNWKFIKNTEFNPGEDLEARVKYLEDTLIYYTDLIKKQGFVIVGSDTTNL